MGVAQSLLVRSTLQAVLLGLAIALCAPTASITAADTENAQKNRRKPLQRCDELKGDAELECLKKARERVVEARKKREEKAGAGEREEKAGAGADKREDKASDGERAEKTRPAADKRERKG
jgi:hypothetical protein